jgi:hypothetical protein
VRIALAEAPRLAGVVGIEPIFGVCGWSRAVAWQGSLRTVAKQAVALFACGMGDCGTLIRHQQSTCTNASYGVACCTNGACNNSPSISDSAIPSRISIGIRNSGVNTMARHRQRVVGSANPKKAMSGVCACPSAPSLTGAGGQSVGLYGGRCVGALGPAGLMTSLLPVCSHASSATLRGGAVKHSHGSRRHERIRHLLLIHRR